MEKRKRKINNVNEKRETSVQPSRKFIKLETIGANLLLGATILALIVSNTTYYTWYSRIFSENFILFLGLFTIKLNLKFFVNDILMTFFFLVVGLEIKYEFVQGALNTFNKAILPLIAALGGMILPALIYVACNYHDAFALRGWAIPTATDIAFSLGIMSLLGKRVLPSLKVLLMALAIIDDLIGILIIAFFYTDHLSVLFLCLSLMGLLFLFILNQRAISSLFPYLLVGLLLWVCLLFAGIHPTLAGVLLSFFIPLTTFKNNKINPSATLKEKLHPWVALGILPLFAFANAGIAVFHISIHTLPASIMLGILFGLLLGKQLGIFGASWLSIKLRIACLPQGVRFFDLYAMAVLCGIGFTISLFIGILAYSKVNGIYLEAVKIGVLSGSLLSGLMGYLLLFFNKKIKL